MASRVSTRFKSEPIRFNFDEFSKENTSRLLLEKESIDELYMIPPPLLDLSQSHLKKCDLVQSFVDQSETSELIWTHFIQRNREGPHHSENIDYIQTIKCHIEQDLSFSGTYRIYAQCTEFSKEIPTDPMHFFIILSIQGKEIWVNHSNKGANIISITDSFGLSKSRYNFIGTTFYIELFKGKFYDINLSKLFTDILRFSYKHDNGGTTAYPGTCSGLTLCVARYIDDTHTGKEFLGQSKIATLARLKIKDFIKIEIFS